ncbi:hypothetical protein QL285_091174 [Trifolium repens]|nr:hypothetical protein QL285_091174 [Trifolium repens]
MPRNTRNLNAIKKEKFEFGGVRNTCYSTLTTIIPRKGKRRNSKPTFENGIHNENLFRNARKQQQHAITSSNYMSHSLRCS